MVINTRLEPGLREFTLGATLFGWTLHSLFSALHGCQMRAQSHESYLPFINVLAHFWSIPLSQCIYTPVPQ
jgi:hypothetical protein